MSTRGRSRGSSTIRLTWTMTMPSLNAVGSTSAGVSSVLGPVYTLPSRSATKPATSATLGIRSTTSRAYSSM